MKRLTIEIHGTGCHNRGAELMAIAIAERMRATFPNVRLVVPLGYGDFESRARHQLHTTYDFPGRFRSKIVSTALHLGAKSIRNTLGLVHPSEVDIVLDASGFAFSDQWGVFPAQLLLSKMTRRERRHQPLILLPQALGTFNQPDVATAAKNLFQRAEFVCARDDQSYAMTKALGGPQRLFQFPDFTLAVKPSLPPHLTTPQNFAAIVPNYRMLDKTNQPNSYIAFLNHAIRLLRQNGLFPAFVLHDANEDSRVIAEVCNSQDLLVLTHPDPRILKGILSAATLVIGSRFHALVSAMSQGVPCIGAGWSHKYPELFRDFDAPDLLTSDLEDLTKLEYLISILSNPAARTQYSECISKAASVLRDQTESMWSKVEATIQNL